MAKAARALLWLGAAVAYGHIAWRVGLAKRLSPGAEIAPRVTLMIALTIAVTLLVIAFRRMESRAGAGVLAVVSVVTMLALTWTVRMTVGLPAFLPGALAAAALEMTPGEHRSTRLLANWLFFSSLIGPFLIAVLLYLFWP